jgi:hypothetical protein
MDEESPICYAYGWSLNYKKEKKILVFNMRSNNTNITIVYLNNSIFLNYKNR